MNFFASMPFNFSFRISVPGLSNPFAALAHAQTSADISYQSESKRSQPRRDPGDGIPSQSARESLSSAKMSDSWTVLGPALSRLPTPSPSPSSSTLLPLPPSRKRGWIPASAEPSQAIVYTSATSGFLDTPSKYRDMAGPQDEQDQYEEVVVDLPPAKRRKGIAGSVISTAFSAALIGAAVGLTVYRLWRDKGKDVEPVPPPPYQEEWMEARRPQPTQPEAIETSASTARPPVKLRAKSVARKPVTRRRQTTRVRPRLPFPRDDTIPSRTHAAGDHSVDMQQEDDGDAKDQMDWIGDKLAQLIEEGKRALGKEIVVMSDTQEDEVDDGSGNWVEEDDIAAHASMSYASPNAPSSIASPPSPMTPMTPSPLTGYAGWGKRSGALPIARQGQSSIRVRNSYTPKARHGKSRSDVGDGLYAYTCDGGIGRSLPVSVPSTPNTISKFEANTPASVREGEQEWVSPEIRQSMERARAAYRQRRGLGFEGM